MIAYGLPSTVRHSSFVALELNGPNRACAAGSLAAAARVRPSETVSRRSPSVTSTRRPALPGHSLVEESSMPAAPLTTRQSLRAVEVKLLPKVWAQVLEIRLKLTHIPVARTVPKLTRIRRRSRGGDMGFMPQLSPFLEPSSSSQSGEGSRKGRERTDIR